MDHVLAWIHGGRTLLKNLQPLCKTCNCRKGTRYLDYRQAQRF